MNIIFLTKQEEPMKIWLNYHSCYSIAVMLYKFSCYGPFSQKGTNNGKDMAINF